jgi:hypothetical protein
MELNGLELLDKEAQGLKSCGIFRQAGVTGEDWFIYDDTLAKEKFKGKPLTKVQREIWTYWKYVFGKKSLYLSEGERRRRIAIAVYGDRTKAGNILNTINKIKRKMEA